jgi:homospermidine synthase
MVEFVGNNFKFPTRQRLLRDEISGGMDELGVLLMGHQRGAYWFGSRLTYDEAHRLCPYNNATSLQVNAPFMAAIAWAMNNPRGGMVEPDDLPFREILNISKPYLGELFGVYTDWTPLRERPALYAEDIDPSDPWQFKNFRMN